MSMTSFYGGRKGQDFKISEKFLTKKAMMNDLALLKASTVLVGEYVMVSYGHPGSANYEINLLVDIDEYGKNYNSTLWQKVYCESAEADVEFLSDEYGFGYKLISSMTGATPILTLETGDPVTPGEDPSVEKASNSTIDLPVFKLHLPNTWLFSVDKESADLDAGTLPTVRIEDKTPVAPATKPSEKTIIFGLPQSLKIEYKGHENISPDQLAEVIWDEDGTNGLGGTINRPALKFKLPDATIIHSINDSSIKSTTTFTVALPNDNFNHLRTGDYLINTANGFWYKVTGKTSNDITFTYMNRMISYIPEVNTEYTDPFKADSSRNEIEIVDNYTDAERTQLLLDVTIPRLPAIEVEVDEIAPADATGAVVPSVKDIQTLLYTLQIHRGTRIWVGQPADADVGNGDIYIDNDKNAGNGNVYVREDGAWILRANIRGVVGDALKILDSKTYSDADGQDSLDNVKTLLEQDLARLPVDDELVSVHWNTLNDQNEVVATTSYWYFRVNGVWDRALITGGIEFFSEYTPNDEPTKTYNVNYINLLIDDNAITNRDKKTFSIQKIVDLTSWHDDNGILHLAALYLTNTVPTNCNKGDIFLVSGSDSGGRKWHDLYIAIDANTPVPISGAYLSKYIDSSTQTIILPEDIITKSGSAITNNFVLMGDNNSTIKSVDILPIASGGTGNANGKALALATPINIGLTGVTATPLSFDGSADINIPITEVPSNLLTGTIDIARLPEAAVNRLVIVADETARFALTTSDVLNGDTVKLNDTGILYYVVDDTKLDQDNGYEIYTATTSWDLVTNKPDLYTKTETDTLIRLSSPLAFEITIAADDWVGSVAPFTYFYSNTAITCGKTGDINPIISPVGDTNNYKDWGKVSKADAVVGSGITFTCNEKKPDTDLLLAIIDFGHLT